MEQVTELLAKVWKQLLKKAADKKKKNPKDDSGLDDDYNKPGLLEFLDQFQKKVESADTSVYPKLTFPYK